MELNAELARQFEEKTGNPLLKTISVKCIDRSGRQILNLYARYDIVNYYYGFLIALDGGGELEKLLLDEVVEFDLDEEHDSEVRGFLREIISGSWRFDVETFISDYMSGDDEDPYVKMQREMTSPLGATHIINLKSAFFESAFIPANIPRYTRLIKRCFLDKKPEDDEVQPATKRPRCDP